MNQWNLVAVKRQWVPEWLWSLFVTPIPLALWPPFRWMLTTPVAERTNHD